MWCILYWHWHHVMMLVLSMAQFHLLAQYDQMRWNMTFWSFDTTGTHISVTCCQQHQQCHNCISYIKTAVMKGNTIFWSCDTNGTNTGITWCCWHWCWCHAMPLHYYQHHVMQTASSMTPLHFLGKDDQNDVKHDFFGMSHHWHLH